MQPAERETALVLRAQCGDRAAFDELLRSVDQSLLRYITAIAGNGAAEDILQEVLVTVVRKIVWLRDPHLFRSWVFRIASREAFRALRRERRSEPITEASAVEEDLPPVDPWLRERLAAAIPRLSEPTRAVIHLHYIEELPLSDVATALEISAGTVKSRLSAALARLRKELA